MDTTEHKENLTKESLEQLQKKIEANRATPNEYAQLDEYIHSYIGRDKFILNSFHEYGIETYQQYIDERKKELTAKNIYLGGALLGKIMGAISVIKKYITNII